MRRGNPRHAAHIKAAIAANDAMLDGDGSAPTFAAPPVKRLDQRSISARQPRRLHQVLAANLADLPRLRRPPKALHRSAMTSNHLRRQHPLKLAPRRNTHQSRKRSHSLSTPVRRTIGAHIKRPRNLPRNQRIKRIDIRPANLPH